MTGFVIFIVIVVVYVLIKFFNANDEQSAKVQSVGGMKVKYATLINKIMAADPKFKIVDSGKTHITIGMSGPAASTVFDLVQTFGTITIRCIMKNAIFGDKTIEWEFNENKDQNAMFAKINADLMEHQISVLKQYS